MYNYDPSVDMLLETSDKPSLAVPDQSLSVRQILDRFRRGTLTEAEISHPGYFDPDSEQDFENDAPFNEVSDLTDLDRVGDDLLRAHSRVKAEKAAAMAAAAQPKDEPSSEV